MQRWYAVHTKPRQERVAEEHLLRQGFSVWLPRASVTRRLRDQWQERIEPLFPRYLFLQADAESDDLSPVRSTRGCSGFVRVDGYPAVVPDAVIAWLREGADPDTGLHRLGRAVGQRIHPGERVRVLEGPFEGAEGLLEARKGEERAVVLLRILAEATRVTLPIGHLTSASALV